MSKWSGKCDFCDHLEMVSAKEKFKEFKEKTKLYIFISKGKKHYEEEIKFSVYEDLIPYFTKFFPESPLRKGWDEWDFFVYFFSKKTWHFSK